MKLSMILDKIDAWSHQIHMIAKNIFYISIYLTFFAKNVLYMLTHLF